METGALFRRLLLSRPDGSLHAAAAIELLQKMLDVTLDRTLGNVELPGNDLVGAPLGDQIKHLRLTSRERWTDLLRRAPLRAKRGRQKRYHRRIDDDLPIENKMLTNMIESAQKRVEGMNFERRCHVLEFDDVINKQREMIYAQRQQVLDGADVRENILGMIRSVIADTVARHTAGPRETWDIDGFRNELLGRFLTPEDFRTELASPADWEKLLEERALAAYAAKEAEVGSEQMRELERVMLLRVVDTKWIEQIDAMEDLKQGISLRSYANVKPVVAYRNEGAELYEQMIDEIRYDTVRLIFSVRLIERKAVGKVTGENHGEGGAKKTVTVKKAAKVGRNEPCPCGSGKKFKNCCGREQ